MHCHLNIVNTGLHRLTILWMEKQKLAWRKMFEHIKELDQIAPAQPRTKSVNDPIIREEKLASVTPKTNQQVIDTPPLNPPSHIHKPIVAKKDQIKF